MPKRAKAGYSSPVRDEAKEATRARIVDALQRVVLEEGVHAFSVATVAKRAGIAHRTVYRHFPSREDLLEALSDVIETTGPSKEAVAAHHARPLLEFAREGVGGLFGVLESMKDRATAEFIIGVALRHNTRGKRERWARIQDEMRTEFPALPPEEQLAGAAVLRALMSSNTWFHLSVQLDVPLEIASRGISRAIELVLADLARRNDELGRSRPRTRAPRRAK